MSIRTCLIVLTVLVLFAPASAPAQRPNAQRPNIPMEQFSAEGTIEAVGRGTIQLVTADEQKWLVAMVPNTLVQVVGTAEADFLRPGLHIRFDAEIDKRNNVKNPIDKLTIFTPVQPGEVGIFPPGMAPASNVERQAGKVEKAAEEPKFGAGAGGVGDAGGDVAAGGKKGGAAGGKGPLTEPCTIAGQITAARKGKLTVSAGRAKLKVELTENAAIEIDCADYSLARPGDKAKITEGKSFAGAVGRAQASKLTIELAEPLTTAKKKPDKPAKPQPAKRSPRAAKETDRAE